MTQRPTDKNIVFSNSLFRFITVFQGVIVKVHTRGWNTSWKVSWLKIYKNL